MKKLRVVLDTNVFVSGFFWSGMPSRIWKEIEKGNLENFISEDIIRELEEILLREKKFGINKEECKETRQKLLKFSTLIVPVEKIEFKKDPNDSKILECAVAGNADYIISGDKHLLKLKEFRGSKIVSPRKMLKILLSSLF